MHHLEKKQEANNSSRADISFWHPGQGSAHK